MSRSQQGKGSGFISRLFGGEEGPGPKEDVIDPEILVRLHELSSKHTFVDVRFIDRDDISYQSLIIDVDANNRFLRIDELYPLSRDIKIVVGEKIEITSRGKGVPVKFTSTISALELFDGSPAYRVVLPTTIKSNQRRSFFRIDVTRDMDVRLHIPFDEGGLGLCTILNISSSGIGFRFDKNITEQIRSTGMMKEAKLTFPGNITMYCDLEVRSYDYKKAPARYTQVGAKIHNLSPSERKQMDKMLLKLQREVKRNENNLSDT
ncbi:MAG: c-di-GMP-binding flagellar brake protein YcgR [Oceanicoccus sp.]|jgi:c-di-GMP-binding flagellar brake protein YcgR